MASLQVEWGRAEKLPLHLLFLQLLQLKIINIPKWHILGCRILKSFTCLFTQLIRTWSSSFIVYIYPGICF
jgi:hypothetical protein